MLPSPAIALGVLVCAFASVLPAQGGQITMGLNLGPGTVFPAGDVDGDGIADLVFDLGTAWQVRSGATGLPIPYLGQVRAAATDRFGGLLGDLDADGCDDLYYASQAGGFAEFRSGRDGSLLFAFRNPNFSWVYDAAADHNADGYDDVMVAYGDPATGLAHVDVLSGRDGTVIYARQFQNSITSSRSVQWVGDVDGDGFVDFVETLNSYGQGFFWVMAGPDFHRSILGNANGSAYKAFDTNGDGRDELLTGLGYLDAVTNQLVWPGSFQASLPMDLDGDGAFDIFVNGQALSGRTHSPFAGTMPSFLYGIGDIDGDGRDEAMGPNGIVYELTGAPPASIVRHRGASGTTSALSRPRIRDRLRPRLGGTMLVDLVGGLRNGIAFLAFGAAVDTDLAPLGAPGNHAYVQPITGIVHVADTFGHARQQIPVPSTTAFLGAAISLQWAVLDPAANVLGVATSNALDLVVGN